MAWTGDVMRNIFAVEPHEVGCTIIFECQHRQYSEGDARVVLKRFRKLPCDQCSAPHRLRIQEIQRGISFDEVLDKLNPLWNESPPKV